MINKFINIINKNQKQCSICLSIIKNTIVITPCFHYFHKNCLSEWLSYNYSCPMCRHHIKCYRLLN